MQTFKKILVALVCVFSMISATAQKKNDFQIRGFHLDLRVQVMKPQALKDFANELASFGINTLVMEWEATFPFESHPLIPNKYAYTKEEIADFVEHCNSLNIDVIPMQQCLGHLEYVLQFPRYAKQRENRKDVSQICPLQSKLNKALFTDLFAEMMELHPSKYFHIGGDEAYLFGECKHCSKEVEKNGKASLLAGHLKMVCDIVVSMGKTPVLWADVANKYPDELHNLPEQTVFVVWNYGWALDRFGDPKKLTDKGFEVWGAPALRSNPDNYYLTRWNYHFENNRDFIPVCRNSNYNGVLMTSWSTSGIYSTIFEDKQTISELIPVRNVYPLSGFRILLAAYAQSLDADEALDVEAFIVSYCKKRFGLNKKQALAFWDALQGDPYEVIDTRVDKMKDLSVEILLENIRQDQQLIHSLKPKRNAQEFEHFVLMTDIRENYLTFKNVEKFVNSKEFKISDTQECINQINTILEKDKVLSDKYYELNKDFLYESEIETENKLRTKRVLLLKERLENSRN